MTISKRPANNSRQTSSRSWSNIWAAIVAGSDYKYEHRRSATEHEHEHEVIAKTTPISELWQLTWILVCWQTTIPLHHCVRPSLAIE